MLELFVSASLLEFRYENVHSVIMQVQGRVQSAWQLSDDECRIERDHWLSPRHRQCPGNDKQDTHDKEPVDDLWLGPPEFLEMMVYRSHKEDPRSATRGFEDKHLDHDAYRLSQEQPSQQDRRQLVPGGKRPCDEDGAKRKRPRISHEDRCLRAVEP